MQMETAIPDFIPGKRPAFNAASYQYTGEDVVSIPFGRRDFYKIWVMKGESYLYFADSHIHIDRPALIFSNPLVPYAYQAVDDDRSGYWCVFTEAFFQNRDGIKSSPLFDIHNRSIFFLDDTQLQGVTGLFDKMIAEFQSDYQHKYDVIQHYISLIVHEAMKLQPADTIVRQVGANERLAALFLDLLERQFPVDELRYVIPLRHAGDYAKQMSVHVNHLNHAVKTITGRSTSTHITNRIVQEAKSLLMHTDWNIADIAYGLGFEYPNHFNTFFKKHTGITPGQFRSDI